MVATKQTTKNNALVPTPFPTTTKTPAANLVNLCHDPDANQTDPIEQTNIQKCRCGDPSVPVNTSFVHNPKKWLGFHQVWVRSIIGHRQQPDLCMVGDSLVEHWNGTIGLTKPQPRLRAVFDKYFSTPELRGLALGASADTSRMLLWHLQNGILDNSQFQPRVWMLLVGTNDLGHGLCSKQSTLDGILYVADTIRRARPGAPVLIHGLLPRGGSTGNGKAMALGRNWKLIQWINQQLQEAVARRPGFYYMDSGELFVSRDGRSMNAEYVKDGIHPEAPGLEAWGPSIVQEVQSIILKQQNTS